MATDEDGPCLRPVSAWAMAWHEAGRVLESDPNDNDGDREVDTMGNETLSEMTKSIMEMARIYGCRTTAAGIAGARAVLRAHVRKTLAPLLADREELAAVKALFDRLLEVRVQLTDEPVSRALTSDQVRAYLLAHGWHEWEPKNPDWLLWKLTEDGRPVLVPMDDSYAEDWVRFGQGVNEIAEQQNVSALRVLADLWALAEEPEEVTP